MRCMQARRGIIDARLAEIRDERAPALLRDAWQQRHGVMCVGVNWERHSARTLPNDIAALRMADPTWLVEHS